MTDTDRAKDFIEKAEKHLSWAQETIYNFKKSGEEPNLEKVEKEFFFLLGLFETIYQATVDAAKKLNLLDIRDDVNRDRDNDELLKYLRFARNSEVHDAVLKWRPSMKQMELKITDLSKLHSVLGPFANLETIFQYIYRVNSQKRLIRAIGEGKNPDRNLCEKTGLQVLLNIDCLSLDSFQIGQGKKKNIYKRK